MKLKEDVAFLARSFHVIYLWRSLKIDADQSFVPSVLAIAQSSDECPRRDGVSHAKLYYRVHLACV